MAFGEQVVGDRGSEEQFEAMEVASGRTERERKEDVSEQGGGAHSLWQNRAAEHIAHDKTERQST